MIEANATPVEDCSGSTRTKLRLIEQCPLFHDLAPQERQEVAERALDLSFPAAAILFRAGEPVTMVSVVVAGRVKLSLPMAVKPGRLVELVGPGQVCCWPCRSADGIQGFTAKAVRGVRVLAWESQDFEELLQHIPALARRILSLLAARLHEQQRQYLELATEQAPQRLARTLLRLSYSSVEPSADAFAMDVPLSRAELAQIIGTSLFTVSRILSVWERTGWTKSHRGRVTVVSPQALGLIAEPHRAFVGKAK